MARPTPTGSRRSVALLIVTTAAVLAGASASAHEPHPRPPVTPRVDVIGPLGNRLPPSYRRRYKRPTYIGGKIADFIAPSSQEAMAWRRAVRLGHYDDNGVVGAAHGKFCPPRRHVAGYFYPKPWEALRTGP